MPRRVGFDIRQRAAWRGPVPPPEETHFVVIEEPKETPGVTAAPRPRRRRKIQVALAAAALLMVLFAVAGAPVQATILTPYTTEGSAVHLGAVQETERVAMRLHVVPTDGDDIVVRQQGGDIYIDLPRDRDDIGLRVRDYVPSDTIRIGFPDGTARTAWTDAEPRPVAAGYADGTVPLETGQYLIAWSSSLPRDDAEVTVEVVRLMDEQVFDSAAMMQKVTLGLGAVTAAAGAVALHFRSGLGRVGDLVLDEASALWDRLRQRVDR